MRKLFLILTLFSLGCVGEISNEEGGCVVNETRQCLCPDGTLSYQICSNGNGFTACTCLVPQIDSGAGTGGIGGSAGEIVGGTGAIGGTGGIIIPEAGAGGIIVEPDAAIADDAGTEDAFVADTSLPDTIVPTCPTLQSMANFILKDINSNSPTFNQERVLYNNCGKAIMLYITDFW